MADAECASPYPGAKEAHILSFADTPHLLKVITTLWPHLPYPNPRKNNPHSPVGNT